jgi:orotate phosphoribosyltransferase
MLETLGIMKATKLRLLELVRDKALVLRPVTLASGQSSDYYIDGKMVLMSSEAAALIGEVLYDLTCDVALDAIGGPEMGAIPMATAAVVRYHQAGKGMEGFVVRKEVKAHGLQKRIEGNFRPGYRVAVVEDVATQGTSVLQAIDALLQEGAKVEVVICLVDRLQGARQRIEARGLRFVSVFTVDDLLAQKS